MDLFAEKFGELLNLSREGQVEMKEMLLAHLRCVQRDSSGIPMKLYLMPRNPRLDVTKGVRGAVVIDPRFGAGENLGLKGDRKGHYSIRINDQWRICFEWPDRSPGPVNVEIVDYH